MGTVARELPCYFFLLSAYAITSAPLFPSSFLGVGGWRGQVFVYGYKIGFWFLTLVLFLILILMLIWILKPVSEYLNMN